MKKITVLLIIIGLMPLLSACVSAKKYKNMAYERGVALADQFNTNKKLEIANEQVATLQKDTTTCQQSYRNLQQKYNDLLRSTSLSAKQLNDEWQNNKAELTEKENKLRKELTEKEKIIAEKENSLKKMQAVLAQKETEQQKLIANLQQALGEFEADELTIQRRNGRVYVSLSEKLLFQSGSADVDYKGRVALGKLAEVINKNANLDVVIEGHTDNVEFKPGPVYKDNWDLSVYRATAIVRILVNRYNVAPIRLVAAGRGDSYPINNNSTENERAQNRRIEIALQPQLNDVYKLLQQNK